MKQIPDLIQYAQADYLCGCGRRHRTDIRQIHVGGPVEAPLHSLLSRHAGRGGQILQPGRSRILLVADQNTWRAAGKRAADSLSDLPYGLDTCIFPGEPVLLPDEKAVFTIVKALRPETELLLAVGSGTLNDLTRFVSSRTGIPYDIVATAPSMDGYASSVTPLIINKMKVTLDACGASAILADPAVLAECPGTMLAAGLGDILGKYSAICDWRLSALVTGEYLCESVADTVLHTVDACRRNAAALGRRDPAAAAGVLEGLLLTGMAMSYVGNSRPASGSEHHLSHFWEMAYIREGRPPVLHGSKVGVAVIMTCALYRHLLDLQPDFAAARSRLDQFDPRQWREQMRRVYGEGAEELIGLEAKSGKNDPLKSAARLGRLETLWPEIRRLVARTIPEPNSVSQALALAGGAAAPADLGLGPALVADGLRYAREIRDRYTVLQLYADLGLVDEAVQLIERLF